MKKTLAILLSMALVICMIPGSAFAATPTIADAEVTLSDSMYDYDGTAKTPSVSAVMDTTPLVEGTDYTVSYENNINAGTASVILTGVGTYASTSKTVTFTIKAIDLSAASINLSAASAVYNGSDQTPTLVVKAGTVTVPTADYAVSWSGTPETVGTYTVTVSPASGKSNCEKSGTASFEIKAFDMKRVSYAVDKQIGSLSDTLPAASIHYYVDGYEATGDDRTFLEDVTKYTVDKTNKTAIFAVDGDYAGKANLANADATETVEIETAANISSVKIKNYNGTAEITSVNGGTYDGYATDVKKQFSLWNGSTQLKIDTDYVVSITDSTSAGEHTITIDGRGAYAGTRTDLKLKIAQKDAKNVRIASIGKQSETSANSIQPVVTDSVGGKNVTLKAGTDYTVSAVQDTSTSNIKQKTLTFQGNYTGTRTVQFEVVPAEYDIAAKYITVTPASVEYTYNGTVQSPKVVVYNSYLDKTELSSGYYTVTYEYVDKAGKVQSTTYPEDAHKYDIYVEGRSPYAGKVKVGSYEIKPFKFEGITATAVESYSSVPNVTVTSTYSNIKFEKGTDYSVLGPYNYTSGKSYVIVSSDGTGNLTSGNKTVEYTVASKYLSNCTVELATGSKYTYQYTGSTIAPKVIVRDGYYNVLTEGTHYTVSYKDADGKTVYSPKDTGTYTIVVTGMGAYAGTKEITFRIVGIDISGYTVTLKESEVKASGYSKTPVISSVKKDFYNVLAAKDYTVSYEDENGKTVYSMSTPGTYRVVVTGKGGYSGNTYATFRIVGEPQAISVAKTSYKVYVDSDSFKISAKATGDGTGFSYVSSDPKVASVSDNGVVTIHKLGRAKITVTTTGMKKSDPVSEEVFVKVYPDKATISKKPWTEGKKGSLRVRWDIQEDATYYEVRYSRDKSFKKGTYKTKKVTASEKYDTQSTSLKELYSGKTYYVKVRAVKVVYNDYGQELKYYGKWSGWRSAKTK